MTVNGIAQVYIVTDPVEIRAAQSPGLKPFLRLIYEDGTVVLATLNLCEMIGGAAKGARERWESQS